MKSIQIVLSLVAILSMGCASKKPIDKMIGEWTWDKHPESHVWIMESKSGYTFSMVDTYIKDPAQYNAETETLTTQLTNGRRLKITYLPKVDKLNLVQIDGEDFGPFSRVR